MRGHLSERRPGVWRIVVSDGSDTRGKRRQIVRTVRGAKRDAQRALTELLRERDQGRLGAGRERLATYLRERWLPAVRTVSRRGRALAPTTAAKYEGAVEHVSNVLGTSGYVTSEPSTSSSFAMHCSRASRRRRFPTCCAFSARRSGELRPKG